VDHNEFSQSVKAVEKAQILEVVDHHRINDFATSQPVSFRNEIVGSTATIIATMFRENQIPIPAGLAGLLLGAVLSDTLLFQSPTTTKKDIDTANLLAAIADLDIPEFGREMFAVSAANMKQSLQETIVQDIKYYDISGCHTMISQCMVSSVRALIGREKEIQSCLESLVEKKGLDLVVTAFTSVAEEGSVFFAAGEKKAAVEEAFPDTSEVGHDLQKGILSRKSQILPKLTAVLER
ncbi:MAG: DHH family phosphoesterase, partial [Solobacterium sp.]|nr:DHH family phosphoesterase [Solobacterium sp.]